jgi:apolipoprotein N-acyltransferase
MLAAMSPHPDSDTASPSGTAPHKRPPRSRAGRLLEAVAGRWQGRALLAALSGTLWFLGCPDFDLWPLAWVAMVPLLWALLDRDGQPRTERPFVYGFIAGLVGNAGGFYWIVGLLERFGHLPFLAALPLFLLLVAYQGLTFAIFAVLLCRLRAQLDVKTTYLAPLCWVACELCVPYVFPFYLALTQAWVVPVIQIADLTGPLGVSGLLVLSSGALFDLSHALVRYRGGRRLREVLGAPAVAAGIVALCLAYGAVRIHQVSAQRAAAPKVKVGIVQANVGINEKFVEGLRERQHALHLHLSQELTRRGAELLVWPESSYPYPIARPVAGDFGMNDLRRVQRGFDVPILFGALTYSRDRDGDLSFYNTALLFDRSGRSVGSFDKNFLLIFGEYLPFAKQFAWLKQLIPAISTFSRGTTTTTFPFELRGQRYSLGPMICYEDIIPAFGRRLFSEPEPPNLMINITNDAWFGATSEPWEHLGLAVFRAVEHRVDLVRAVNTGVSAFIDATGRMYAHGPSVDPALTPDARPVTLLEDAALMQPGGMYQQLGETFGGVCLVLVLLCGVLVRSRSGRPVRWSLVLLTAAGLHIAVLLTGLLLSGGISATYAALLHRNEAAIPDDRLFAATWQLLVILPITGAAIGTQVARRVGASADETGPGTAGTHGTLELLSGIALTTVLPVVVLGRMEGNTGAVVILSLLCAAAALLGLRTGRALARRPRA